MISPTCPIHGEPQCRVDGQTCTCWRVTFIVSDGTVAPPIPCAEWSMNLQVMREWKATVHGEIDGSSELFNRFFEKPVREPVPDAFQSAFKDGELEP